jgi:hypothetical protein
MSNMAKITCTRRLFPATIVFLLVLFMAFLLVKVVLPITVIELPAQRIKKQTVANDASNPGNKDLRCFWKLGNNMSCTNHLMDTRIAARNGDRVARWIFLGDSTIWRLFSRSPLLEHLSTEISGPPCPGYSCENTKAGRCDNDQILGFHRVETWQVPNKREGPVVFGLENPFCLDCGGCLSQLLHCTPPQGEAVMEECEKQKPSGGYFSIEFARDVELQSRLYDTTQQNFAQYLDDKWNTPVLVL